MSKRKIVSFLLLLLLTVSVFIANIIIIENAKGQLPDVTQLTYCLLYTSDAADEL